jgi:hypothetical protein
MLEKEIALKFKKKINSKTYLSKSEIRISPAEIDLILLDRFSQKLISYEFKRGNWKKTFTQALRNKLYCHFSYAVLPSSELSKIDENEFKGGGIGLILYFKHGRGLRFKEIIKPEQSKSLNRNLKKQVYKKFTDFF